MVALFLSNVDQISYVATHPAPGPTRAESSEKWLLARPEMLLSGGGSASAALARIFSNVVF